MSNDIDVVIKITNATFSKEFNETRENQEYRGTSLKQEFLSQKSLHPLLLSLAVQFLQQWCGMNVLIFKTVAVFHEIGWRNIVQLDTIILGVVHLLTVLFKPAMDRVVRFFNPLPLALPLPSDQFLPF